MNSAHITNLNEILPGMTDRGLFVGMTGSGKSTLAMEIVKIRLRRDKHVVIYDAKGDLRLPPNLINAKGEMIYTERVESFAECVKSKAPGIIYAPNHTELDLQDPAMFSRLNDFFRWIYERKNCTLYVDEVYSIIRGRTIPHYFHALLTRGRGLNISVLNGTQRPKDIPQTIMSEAEHYYIFKLLLPQDQKKIEEICALRTERIQALLKREFYYHSIEDGDIIGPNRLVLNT